MESAWIAAKRGYNVTLYEKEDRLGGAFLVAAYPPGKSEIVKVIAYYEHQCKKYGVDIQLNIDVDESVIKNANPDVIIIATGSKPLIPSIKV